jgi:hypothetical protein
MVGKGGGCGLKKEGEVGQKMIVIPPKSQTWTIHFASQLD